MENFTLIVEISTYTYEIKCSDHLLPLVTLFFGYITDNKGAIMKTLTVGEGNGHTR